MFHSLVEFRLSLVISWELFIIYHRVSDNFMIWMDFSAQGTHMLVVVRLMGAITWFAHTLLENHWINLKANMRPLSGITRIPNEGSEG